MIRVDTVLSCLRFSSFNVSVLCRIPAGQMFLHFYLILPVVFICVCFRIIQYNVRQTFAFNNLSFKYWHESSFVFSLHQLTNFICSGNRAWYLWQNVLIHICWYQYLFQCMFSTEIFQIFILISAVKSADLFLCKQADIVRITKLSYNTRSPEKLSWSFHKLCWLFRNIM